jgi:hypothetical protein
MEMRLAMDYHNDSIFNLKLPWNDRLTAQQSQTTRQLNHTHERFKQSKHELGKYYGLGSGACVLFVFVLLLVSEPINQIQAIC